MATQQSESNGKFIFFIILIILALIGYCNRNKSSTDQNINLSSEEMQFNAFAYSQTHIKKKLKSPESAEFSTNYHCLANTKDSTYVITSSVNAKNPYGVLLSKRYMAKVKFLGGEVDLSHNWELLELTFYE